MCEENGQEVGRKYAIKKNLIETSALAKTSKL
jgi:hypothetical protein